uniref:C2 domain-containing protein n=1 Tax=Ditylenchus dipsaci TaxID=166011 RepID=A0A915CYD4_9BILA
MYIRSLFPANDLLIGQKEDKEKKFLGLLSYKLDYDFEKNALTVVEELLTLCQSLPPARQEEKVPDKSAKESLNPVFNETFTFKVPFNEIASQTLLLNVFDFDRFGKHDQIGIISVPLGKIDLTTTIEKTAPIEAPPENRLGEVCLALRYVPNKQTDSGGHGVQKLERKWTYSAFSDPYVKIYLMMQNKS